MADPVTFVAEVAISIALSYVLGKLADRKNNLARDDKPTTVSTRGAYIPWLLGMRRIGSVFAWAGNRRTRTEKMPGGKGQGDITNLFGLLSGPDMTIFVEDGVHILCVGICDELQQIQISGKVVFKGPISRNSHPSGSEIDLGNEGSFFIYWGEDGGSLTGDVPDPDAFVNARQSILSRWPLYTRIVWKNKRLGGTPNWPMIEYQVLRKPLFSQNFLTATDAYFAGNFSLDGTTYAIDSAADGAEGTGVFSIFEESQFINTEGEKDGQKNGYYASHIKDGDKMELVGNSMPDQTITVLKTEAFRSITLVYPVGGVSGSDHAGTLQLYTRSGDDGLNPAHCIAELLFAPWPFGLGQDSSNFNVGGDGNSLEALGLLMDDESIRVSLLAKDGESAESVLAGLLQDIGVMVPLNTQTGLIDFVPVRDVTSDTLQTISLDMQAGSLPEIETHQGPLPQNMTVFSFSDRDNFFRDMTIQVSADGQASFLEDRRSESVPMPSVIDLRTAGRVAERRAQEQLSGGTVYTLSTVRGARELIPGQAVHIEGIDNIARLMSIKVDTESAEVKIEAIDDFMGSEISSFEVTAADPAGGTIDATTPSAPIQFDVIQVPSDLSTTSGILVPQIRASGEQVSTAAYISGDDSTYYLKTSTHSGQAGGVLTQELAIDGGTPIVAVGPTFDSLGPDIDNVLDLSGDSASWNAGRQILLLVTDTEYEICFLESITSMGGDSYQLNNIIRAQHGTSQIDAIVGTRAYIFQPTEPLIIQDVLIYVGATVYVKMVPGGLSTADITARSVTIV